MMRGVALGFLIGSALVAHLGAGALACGGNQLCTLVGCGAKAQFSATIAASYGDEITVEACQNAACGQATVTLTGECTGCAVQCDLQAAGVVCTVDEQGEGGAWRVLLSWHGGGPSAGIDGDTYSAKVTRISDAEVLAVAEEQVTYRNHYPNGPECDAEPCRVVDGGAFGL